MKRQKKWTRTRVLDLIDLISAPIALPFGLWLMYQWMRISDSDVLTVIGGG